MKSFVATRSRKLIASATAVVALSVGGFVSMPNAEAAPASCMPNGTINVPGMGIKAKFDCTNFLPTEVYANRGQAFEPVGTLDPGTNWVICHSNPALANPTTRNRDGHINTNHIWLYTQADNRAWGWEPATFVTQGGDEVAPPGVPACY